MAHEIRCTGDWSHSLLAGGMIGGAQFMEHVIGLDPCPLCLMQRLWTMFGGAVVLAGLAHNPRSLAYPTVALACTVVGAGFSVRQLWLQSLPADAVPACGPDMAYMIDAFPLADILKAMTWVPATARKSRGRCSASASPAGR